MMTELNQEPIRLHCVERGHGPPVILIHGFPLDHTIWQAQVAALSDRFRLITPDLRGHGQTATPGGTYDMDLMARDVLTLMNDLEIARAVWIGHSMGGYVALSGLRLAPDRLSAVGLVATHPHADPPEKRLQRRQSAEAALARGVSDLALSLMGVLFAPALDRQSEEAQAIYQIMIRAAPQGVAGAQRGMAERPDSLDVLRQADLPVLAVAGAEDQIVPSEVMTDMVSVMANARLVTIPGAGHMPMIEQPALTTAALRDFLSSLPDF
jgi:3-oxoadipate enol-lactonase